MHRSNSSPIQLLIAVIGHIEVGLFGDNNRRDDKRITSQHVHSCSNKPQATTLTAFEIAFGGFLDEHYVLSMQSHIMLWHEPVSPYYANLGEKRG
jgi:hypothetical protein